ncbi:MAG: CinA family protein [Roseobacter sp.]
MTHAKRILDLAQNAEIKIATAESCTGGLVAVALTDIAGSSSVVERAFVTYSNDAKMDMLGVTPRTLKLYGAVSEQVAREMAIGALQNSKADLTVSITGIAGPGGSDHKPEGRVCFAKADKNDVFVETIEFGALGRAHVRTAARDHALGMLLNALGED